MSLPALQTDGLPTPERLFTHHIDATAIPVTLVNAAGWADWQASAPRGQLAWAKTSGFAGKPGEIALLPGNKGEIIGVLAGVKEDKAALRPDTLASLAERLPAGVYTLDAPDAALGNALVGWALGQYRFTRYQGSAEAREPRVLVLPHAVDSTQAVALARASALTQDLINTPTADMGPAELAGAAQALASAHGALLTSVHGDELLTQNFPTIHAVGRAAATPPQLIDLVWGDPDAPKVTIIGKGVCFDSGGLNLKPGNSMALMKKDMGGAAHALGLASAIMELGLPVRLRVLIPAVENAVSGNAFRPGDVLRTRAGLTVEVTNTDAEGRLVLSDALTLAVEDGCDLLIDLATLTGAARVALGPDLPALFSSNDALATQLLACGTVTSDPMWQLPLWAGYGDMLKSSIADLVNAADGPFAGAVTAALFLERFTNDHPNWLHLDLYAWQSKSRAGAPVGGKAMGLRAIVALLKARY